ncbi:MAG TPA: DUF4331 family protein [Candidatus Xenobia bacterium]|jgi:hypothetical protein
MNKKLSLAALAMALVAVAGTLTITRPTPVRASDHDDGETDTKSRNTNLTDLYVFREGDQDGVTADNSNLIIALNLNPRSVPRQQYFFNQTANYVINVGQNVGSASFPSGAPNFQLRLTFGTPDSNGQQGITISKVPFTGAAPTASPNFNSLETASLASGSGRTQRDIPGISTDGTASSNLTDDNLASTGTSTYSLDGQTLTVFAGLREDPFFFDVTQFFRVRAGLEGLGPVPSPLFRTPATAVDFTKDYNVLSIVIRAPIAFLQQGNSSFNTFDVFATIEQPNQ